MNDDNVGGARNLRYGREIAERIVRKFFVERRAHEVRIADHEQRVAIGRCFRGRLRADRRAGAGTAGGGVVVRNRLQLRLPCFVHP